MGHSQGNHGIPTLLMNSADQKKKRSIKVMKLTEAPPSVSIQDMGEKAYRQWWADDACPPHDPFLLEHSCILADEGLWQEEKCE